MKEQPRLDSDTEHDTDTRGTVHSKRLTPGTLPEKPRRSAGPDFNIDLEAADALEKLDRLYDEIEREKPPSKETRVPEAGEQVTEADERELEEEHAASDRRKAERKLDPLLGPEYRLHKACEDAAIFLYELARAGYDKEDFLRLAKKEVEKIRAELDPAIGDARILEELLARFQEERILSGKPEPRTKTVKLDLGVPPESDDDTQETRLP